MTAQQLNKFAWGLANSENNFLWIIRPDIVSADTAILPPEFMAETKNRGICGEWGIGLEIDSDVKREEVEKLVREVMEGEKGKEMKTNAMEWKKKA
ncbi:hypothetical protein ACSBR2_018855 [Camellia fascicularis]